MAWPCLIAAFCSDGSEVRAEEMASKAVEEGKASVGGGVRMC